MCTYDGWRKCIFLSNCTRRLYYVPYSKKKTLPRYIRYSRMILFIVEWEFHLSETFGTIRQRYSNIVDNYESLFTNLYSWIDRETISHTCVYNSLRNIYAINSKIICIEISVEFHSRTLYYLSISSHAASYSSLHQQVVCYNLTDCCKKINRSQTIKYIFR